jgi:hypothetical protein
MLAIFHRASLPRWRVTRRQHRAESRVFSRETVTVQALPAGRQESKNRDKQLTFIVRVIGCFLFFILEVTL